MSEVVLTELGKMLLPIGGSGVVGFVMGYAMKKVLKLIAIGGGLVLALIAFLEVKGMINVNWDVITSQTYSAANSTLQTVSQIAQHVSDKVDSGVGNAMMGGSVGMFAVCFLVGLKRG